MEEITTDSYFNAHHGGSMAKRFTDTALYDKSWFRKLPPRIKCLWEYLLKKCDHAGVIDFDPELASFQIGEEINMESLEYFGDRIEKIGDSKFFIKGFVKFQYGRLSQSSNPHISVIKELKKHGLYERVMEGLGNPSAIVKDKEQVKDKDKDKVKEKEKEYEIHYEILQHWNSCSGLIKHRDSSNLQSKLSKRLSQKLKNHPLSDIKKSISNYSEAISQGWWTHKWSIVEFMTRESAEFKFFPENYVKGNWVKTKPVNNSHFPEAVCNLISTHANRGKDAMTEIEKEFGDGCWDVVRNIGGWGRMKTCNEFQLTGIKNELKAGYAAYQQGR